ncbi:MAG: MNIO family bufferin maturase [Gammaproteobacteria bacterium]
MTGTSLQFGRSPIPARAGIGLRSPHYREIIETRPAVAWFELHSENCFCEGGFPLHEVERIRQDYPLSFHGVGLSLGSTDPLDRAHLARLRERMRHFEPHMVSEHLSWSSVDQRHLHDLLPLPHTLEAVRHVAERISHVQEYLGREILIENISDYLEYREAEYPEWQFLVETAHQAGCGILLDINNIYVNAMNHGFEPQAYIDAVPRALVREIHLAGHTVNQIHGQVLRIDTHNRPVSKAVWDLYRHAVARFGPLPTLIEWDADIPPLDTLLHEAARAQAIVDAWDAVPA